MPQPICEAFIPMTPPERGTTVQRLHDLFKDAWQSCEVSSRPQ
jgi:hypothetical protein